MGCGAVEANTAQKPFASAKIMNRKDLDIHSYDL
jgi:hypothetical protein